MRITKRQLRRLIKEEKRKILKETVADMVDFEIMVEEAADKLAWQFGDAMFDLLNEDPEAFEGRSTPEEWEHQVKAAQQDLAERLKESMNSTIESIETELHDGQYHPRSGFGGPG